MENIMANLSPNVKKYFVNALKGIGVLIPDKEGNWREQTEAEIESSLQNPNLKLLDIYDAIAIAVAVRVGDHEHFPALAETTKFDRQTIKGMMAKGFGIDDNNREDFAFKLTTGKGLNNDIVVGKVIDTLHKGVIHQKITVDEKQKPIKLTPADIQTIQTIWNQIRCANFEKYLSKYPNKYNKDKFEKWIIDNENAEYNQLKRQYDLDQAEEYLRTEFKTYYNCDEQVANAFLSQGIQDETLNYLKTNGPLMKNSVDECLRRLKIRNQIPPQLKEALAEAEDKGFSSTFNVLVQNGFLTMQDVCLAAGNTKEQIAMFFQNRSMEQEAEKRKGSEAKNGNKKDKSKTENIGETLIGNLMGASGRKYVKHITGKKAAVRYNWKFFKLGKKGPWRGYKAIFDRINSHLGTIYGNLQAIGFSQAFVERMTGYKFLPQDTAVKVDENEKDKKEVWQTDYQPAMKEYRANGKLNVAGEFYNETQARLLSDRINLHKISLLNVGLVDNQQTALESQMKYLQQRIETAEDVLANKLPKPENSDFNNVKYYNMLENHILAEDQNKNNAIVKSFIEANKNNSANQNLVNVLNEFKALEYAASLDEQQARREMAKDIFHIRNRGINNETIDDMSNRFVNGICFKQILSELTNNKTTVDVVMAEINQFVENDLQNYAMRDQYNQHKIEDYRKEITKAVIDERQM